MEIGGKRLLFDPFISGNPLAQKIEGPLLGYTSTATLTGGGLFGFIKFMVSVGIMFGLIIVNYLFFGVLKSFTL